MGRSTFSKDVEEPEKGIMAYCYNLAPSSEAVRSEHLINILDYLGHCIHEWLIAGIQEDGEG